MFAVLIIKKQNQKRFALSHMIFAYSQLPFPISEQVKAGKKQVRRGTLKKLHRRYTEGEPDKRLDAISDGQNEVHTLFFCQLDTLVNQIGVRTCLDSAQFHIGDAFRIQSCLPTGAVLTVISFVPCSPS